MCDFLTNRTLLTLVLGALAFAGVAIVFAWLRCPPWYTGRVARAFRKSGLCAHGEYPTLRSVKHDPQKKHGLIFRVKHNGVSIPDMDKQVERLKIGLGGLIYGMEYTNKAKDTLIYVLPWKYVRPAIFSPNDNAIGAMSLRHLINLLVIGATGTGKTVAIKILMTKIAKFQPDAKVWLLDFKRFDFRALADLPRYYGYTDCAQGLNDYYDAFKAQQEAGEAAAPNYLIIDEWGSFIMSLEKKEAEQLKGKLAELLMLGRTYKFFPIVGIQRPDSAYFAAARDNFQSCLALGNLSPEGRRMAFPDSVTSQIVECKKREGHLYIDGVGLEKIHVADISDLNALDEIIRETISR